MNFFKKLTDQGIRLNTSDIRTTYKLVDPYFALGPNCTTLSLNAMNVGLRNFTKNSSKYIDSTKVLGRMLSTAMKAKYQEPNYLYLLDNLKDYLESQDVAIKVNVKKFYHAKNQPKLPSERMRR